MKRLILTLLTSAALAVSLPAYAAVKTIVLVHGAFADGSGWKPVADILQSHGYSVLGSRLIKSTIQARQPDR
jgi:alpha-beta hydrolase superfamily lysophospholipase